MMNHINEPTSNNLSNGIQGIAQSSGVSVDSQQQESEPSTVLAFPPPPFQYIRKYTNENVKENKAPKPPRPITDGQYHMFGQLISTNDAIIAPLESHGTKRLYPRGDYDHKKELKKMNASILVNFLDLVDVLVRCPDTDKRSDKCNDLALLFINFHHLINELRPHQARETIRVWMSLQKKSRIDTTQKLLRELDRAYSTLSLNSSALTLNFEQKHNQLKLLIDETLKLIRSKRISNQINKDNEAQNEVESNGKVDGQLSSMKMKNYEFEYDQFMCDMIDELVKNEIFN